MRDSRGRKAAGVCPLNGGCWTQEDAPRYKDAENRGNERTGAIVYSSYSYLQIKLNNKEFISGLSKRAELNKEQTQKLVNEVVAAMSDIFDDGDNVTIANFGTFEPKKRMERVIVNPASGQRMLVPPKIVLAFKPAAQVRYNIKKGGAE